MIANYFKTAIRKIWREPFFNILNIAAFSLSMSLSLLILVIIGNQFDYDSHNTRKDRIFRINTLVETESGGKGEYATSPIAVREYIDESTIQEWLRLTPTHSRFKTYQNDHIAANGYFVEGDFFNFFQIPLLEGDAKHVLSDPHNIALSKEASLKLFNTLDVIGTSVDIENLGTFTISGVYDISANKTHLSNDFVLSQTLMQQLVKSGKLDDNLLESDNYTSGYFYAMAKDGVSVDALKSTVKSIATSISSQISGSGDKIKISFFTQSLEHVSPGKDMWMENGRGLSYSTIGLFILIICVLLALTCFNYSSVMTSLGLAKSKEIGIRKIVGATKRNVFFQFIAESMVIAFISFGIGILLFPLFTKFSAFQQLTNDLTFNGRIIIALLLFVILVGVLAGLLPAMTLSKLKEKDLMSNVFKKGIMKGISFRKVIIALQFSVSMVMILFAATLIRQTQLMTKGDYGFDYTDIISININSQREYAVIEDAVNNMPEVLSISSISTNLGYMPTDEFDSWHYDKNEKVLLSAYYLDENAINDLGLSVVSGEDFSSNHSLNTNRIILNERSIEALKLGDATAAIGQEIRFNDSLRYTVSGVVKDFHFQNFKRSIAPMAFLYHADNLGVMNLKIHPQGIDEVVAKLENLSLQTEFGSKIDYFFWDEVYRDLQSHNDDILMVIFLTMTLVVIGCIGLIGILAYSVQQRRKEVTIRKIIGAGFNQIFILLTREYILLLLIAIAVGVPIGYLVADQFLQEFAYRIDLNLSFLLLPVGTMVIIGGAVLLFTSVKSCMSVPIENLRGDN